MGFVTDVGDLMKLVMTKDGIRDVGSLNAEALNEKMAHELSDCLWSVLILAKKYNIDLEKSFLQTMDELERKIGRP